VRFKFGRHAGQNLPHRLGKNHFARLGFKASNQADLPLRSTGVIPWDPDAVRVAQFGPTVVVDEVFREEHKLARGGGAHMRLLRVVIRVDRQRPVRQHGFLIFAVKKKQASAKASYRLLAPLVQNGVRPYGGHAIWDLRIRVLCQPRDALGKIKLRAAAERQDAGEKYCDA
jgi:hypothetical protein